MIAPDDAVSQVEMLANKARCPAICMGGRRLMAVFRAVGEMLILPL